MIDTVFFIEFVVIGYVIFKIHDRRLTSSRVAAVLYGLLVTGNWAQNALEYTPLPILSSLGFLLMMGSCIIGLPVALMRLNSISKTGTTTSRSYKCWIPVGLMGLLYMMLNIASNMGKFAATIAISMFSSMVMSVVRICVLLLCRRDSAFNLAPNPASFLPTRFGR